MEHFFFADFIAQFNLRLKVFFFNSVTGECIGI